VSEIAMHVFFRLNLPHPVDEQFLRTEFDMWRSVLLTDDADDPDKGVYGAVVIRDDSGGELAVEDELWNIVRALCFEGASDLAAGKAVRYHYAVADHWLIVTPVDDIARIESAGDPTLTAPRRQLAISLVQCGERYLELVERLAGESLTYHQLSEMLRPLAAKAAKAVENE
jgi:hypothetical protein